MYKLLGLYNNNGNINYAVQDTESGVDLDVFTESEIKLLVSSNIELYDIDNNRVSLSGGALNCNVPDVTNELPDMSSEDDSDYDYVFDEGEEDEEDEVFGGYIEEDEVDEYDEYDSDDDEDYVDFGSYDEDEEDEEEPEESTVSKLYRFLNEEQIVVLKRYYLWYSQRLFTDAQKDPTLGIKSQKILMKKKSDLDALRNSGGMWYYAGFVDMGYRGAGFCTLGHPLRFMHLAWDVSVSDIETAFFGENYDKNFEEAIQSANCIKFGIKCISDFFEVDSECTRSLQRAQRESLKDMALMYDFYSQGRTSEVISKFELTDELVAYIMKIDTRNGVVNEDYVPTINRNLALFYTQFRKLDMIPPKSLVQEIRDNIVGWKNGHVERQGHLKVPDSVAIQENVKKMFSGEFDVLASNINLFNNYVRYICCDYKNQIIAYTYRLLMYKICGFYEYDADVNTEEGGASKTSKAELARLISNTSKLFFSDVEYTFDYWQRLCELYCMELFNINDSRLYIPTHDYSKDDMTHLVLSDRKTRYAVDLLEQYQEESGVEIFNAFKVFKALSNSYRLLQYPTRLIVNHDPKVNISLTEFENLIADSNKLMNANIDAFRDWCIAKELKYIEDRNKDIDADIERRRLEREKKDLELREEQALEEAKKEEKEQKSHEFDNIKTSEDVVEYLKNQDLSKVGKDFDLSKSILNTVIKSGKPPSSKQFWHIKKLYESISGVEFKGNATCADKINLEDRQDLVNVVDYVLSNTDDFDDIEVAICTSVKKYKSVSDKQLKYLLSAQGKMKDGE